MLPDESTGGRSRLLTSLVEATGVRHGREDSFKMSRGRLLAQRFMLGVHTRDVTSQRILQWCEALGMPERFQAAFTQHLPDANLVFLGLEDGSDHGVFKVYLEFWEKVRREVLRTGRTDPMLLHLGFKWRAGDDGSDGRIARYTCFPRLTVRDTLARIGAVCGGAMPPQTQGMVTDIVRRAAQAAPSELFLYVEVAEEGNPRKSFDINLYKAGLTMADIAPSLQGLARHHDIPDELFLPLMARIAGQPLGHLSSGLDRASADFVTLYYETRAIDP